MGVLRYGNTMQFHRCDPPYLYENDGTHKGPYMFGRGAKHEQLGTGAQWQCDECKAIFELVNVVTKHYLDDKWKWEPIAKNAQARVDQDVVVAEPPAKRKRWYQK